MYVCMYVCVYVRTYACMCVYVYVCTYVCMHVCVYGFPKPIIMYFSWSSDSLMFQCSKYIFQGLFQSFSQGGANGRSLDLKGGQLLIIIIFICNVNFDVF